MEEIDMMKAIISKGITSCNCMTKTNVVIYHKPTCRYRKFMEELNDTTNVDTLDLDLECRENVMKLLQEGECILRFENSDGDIQNIAGIANPPPEANWKPSANPRAPIPLEERTVQPFWDVDAGHWKCFTWNKLVNIFVVQ